MPLSRNEIKRRATAFAREWKDETRENSEAKSFWDGFRHSYAMETHADYQRRIRPEADLAA